jgi:hydrogenase maturation factor
MDSTRTGYRKVQDEVAQQAAWDVSISHGGVVLAPYVSRMRSG